MKKQFILLLCCILIVGCGKAKESNHELGKIDQDKIVATIGGVTDYAVAFYDIPSLAEASEVIIYGEVVNGEYIADENGVTYTNEDVKVLKSLKGEYKENDVIKVTKDQGIVSARDYIESFTSEFQKEESRKEFSQYKDEELDDIYVRSIGQNDVMSEVGQRAIYFLIKSTRYDKEQTYTRLTMEQGEYLEIADNQFVLTQIIGQELNDPYTLSENEVAESEMDFSLTMDEIMTEVDTAD